MTSKEVKDGIVDNLGPFLKDKGYRKVRDGYQKKLGDFVHFINYTWLIGDNCRPTSFGFWVQSRSVYIILKNALDQEVKKNNYTTLISLSQSSVFKLKPKEFQVDNYADIVVMCDAVKKYLLEEGFSFFESKTDYNDILCEMKSTSPPQNFYSLGYGQWAFNALILSKVTNDNKYSELANQYLEFTKATFGDGNFLNQLNLLNSYLQNTSVEKLQEILNEPL